ncbi:MAG: LacI family DNA-binding transcriptional regulator [Planctomycetota bacterium]
MATTIRQLADSLGVSRQTVSDVLSGKGQRFREETRVRVAEAARRAGYRPNGAAKAVFNKQMLAVGAVIVNTTDPGRASTFYGPHSFQIIVGANQRFIEHGYVLSLVNVGGESESRVFTEHLLDGLLVIGKTSDETLEKIREAAEHAVLVETNQWRPKNCLRRDERHVGQVAVDAALGQGCDRLIWVGIDEPDKTRHYSQAERRRGVIAAARATGLPIKAVNFESGTHTTWRPDPIFDAIDAALMHQPHRLGVIFYSEKLANWTLGRLSRKRPELLDQLWLGACDLDTRVPVSGNLGGVLFDRFKLGIAAADMLLGLIKSGKPQPSRRLELAEIIRA